MAEGVFQRMVNEAGLADKIVVDSAGTGSWHVGETAHRGTLQVLRKYGIAYNGRSRQVRSQDITPTTYVIALDQSNQSDLRHMFGDIPRLHRLLDFASETNERDVPDPYYSGNFDYVYKLVEDGCQGLLQTIRQNEEL